MDGGMALRFSQAVTAFWLGSFSEEKLVGSSQQLKITNKDKFHLNPI
jgi:hypothetical protein